MSDLRSGGFSEYLSSGNDVLAGSANLPKQAADGSRSLTGIPGESRKATHLLLYPTLDQSRFIEIAHEDIVGSKSLNAEESPFGAAGGVRVIVRQNATITSGLVAKDGEAGDDFDLDIRLGMAGNVEKRDEGDDTDDDCDGTDNGDCDGTDNGDCGTNDCPGRTQAKEDTCFTCNVCRETIEICVTRETCETCETCATCATCETCETCATCGVDCGRPTVVPTRCADECGIGTRATCSPECQPK
ncbi:MAG: hypothetical protein WB676_28020 [Bryobacteraceae bacterium]